MNDKTYKVSLIYKDNITIDIDNVTDILLFSDGATSGYLTGRAQSEYLQTSLVRVYLQEENKAYITDDYIVFKLKDGEQLVSKENLLSFKIVEINE